MSFFLIFLIALMQAQYDYLGWYVWLREPPPQLYDWRVYLFRFLKLVLDVPVTIYVLYMLGFSWQFMGVFYFWKWCGGCDMFYFVFQILRGELLSHYMTWFWWSPYGAYDRLRGNRYITPHEYFAQIGIAYLIIWLSSLLLF